jgi:hypothetical protein
LISFLLKKEKIILFKEEGKERKFNGILKETKIKKY